MKLDTVVIGAGVIGLACARALALQGRDVVLLERGNRIAEQTSARNSEVIHAGLYYPTGSSKARFCVEGRRKLYAYLRERQIDHSKCGKLIVANGAHEVAKLKALAAQAEANGVEGMRYLSGSEARELEPALPDTISAALHSAETGILDSHAYYLSLLGDFERAGGSIAYQSDVLSGRVSETGVQLRVGDGNEADGEERDGEEVDGDEYEVEADLVINAAGLRAVRLAAAIDGPHVDELPTPRFAKGHYFSVSGTVPFRHLIYPMPNEAGLGTHLTLDLSGRGRLGPDVEWLPEGAEAPFDYSVPDALAETFHQAAKSFWPDLRLDQLSADYAGIRPKLVGPGQPPADFVIQNAAHGRLINLLGIESPGLTASLAIGDYVADLAA